jgi:hypothetical protein
MKLSVCERGFPFALLRSITPASHIVGQLEQISD